MPHHRSEPSRMVERWVKRGMDIVGASAALVALAPVLLCIAMLIWAVDGRPILFAQPRTGKDRRIFVLRKFRTMRSLAPGEGKYERDAERVTRLGRTLRTWSLDELPELWHVLRGDMSLVGPRPLLPEYLDAYTEDEDRRHRVRPGLTGWAVVHGRHAIDFERRLALDRWYVDHWTLGLDVVILSRTIGQLIKRSGVSPVQEFDDIALPERFRRALTSPTPTGPSSGRETRHQDGRISA